MYLRNKTKCVRFLTVLTASLTFLVLTGSQAGATSSADLDIGSPQKAGGTSFSNGVYIISGGGTDIAGTSDHFHFNKGTLTRSGVVTAFVQAVGPTNSYAKSGVMLRSSTKSDSAMAAVLVTLGQGIVFEYRTVGGHTAVTTWAKSVKAPVWVKVRRAGSKFTGSYSGDGKVWTQIGSVATITMNATVPAGTAVCAHASTALCSTTFTNIAVTPDVDSRYLHTQGNGLCDRNGASVTLRGTNVGGWLVTEGWMCGQTDNGGRFALEQLEARFGTAQAATLINAWRDNWFTDRDMDNIHSYGFNCIRVPFSWRNVQDANGNWYLNAQGSPDFSRFDWVVQEAAKRNMYVIFDYHIWPGQQQDYGTICQGGEPGNTQRTQSAAIWSALAKHFQGNGTVAAFDLINEPTGSNDYYDAHRAFYAAIRAQDPERMLVAEWVNTNDFAGLGWTNTMCSGHYPAGNKADLDKFVADLPKHNEYSTVLPCFVGECKSDDTSSVTQNAADMAQGFDNFNWAWATWTYKTVNEGGWGLFDYNGSLNYNLATDTYDSLLTLWTTGLTQWQNPANPVNYYLKSDIISGLQQGASSYVAPPVAKSPRKKTVDAASGLKTQTSGKSPLSGQGG